MKILKFFVLVVFTISFIGCSASRITEIKVEKLAETSKSWNGDELPNYPTGKPKITVLKITIPPKTKLHKHYHHVINSGILLKGELKVVDIDNNILLLKEGDVIVELVNRIHYGINEGKKPVEIVVFYAGEVDKPITILAKD